MDENVEIASEAASSDSLVATDTNAAVVCPRRTASITSRSDATEEWTARAVARAFAAYGPAVRAVGVHPAPMTAAKVTTPHGTSRRHDVMAPRYPATGKCER